jgi:hypothetical protein
MSRLAVFPSTQRHWTADAVRKFRRTFGRARQVGVCTLFHRKTGDLAGNCGDNFALVRPKEAAPDANGSRRRIVRRGHGDSEL